MQLLLLFSTYLISACFISYESTFHLFLYLKAELRYIRFRFWRPSWPPSFKICNCCYCFLHIWFLRPLFHMNRHFICRYIWKQSWDTLDPEFRRPCWPPSWIFILFIFIFSSHLVTWPFKKLEIPLCYNNRSKNFSSSRVIHPWNFLPQDIISISNPTLFKKHISQLGPEFIVVP